MSNFSFVVYAGDGGEGPFAVPFDYLDKSHVAVTVDGASTAFTWLSDASIALAAAAPAGAAVKIQRTTPRDPLVDFTDGSILTEADLDASALQQAFIAQEVTDLVKNSVTLGDDGSFTASGRRITNLSAPTASQDAATKSYADSVSGADQAAAAALSAASALVSQSAAEAARAATEAVAANLPLQGEDIADGGVSYAKLQNAASAGYLGAGGAGPLGLLALAQLRSDAFSVEIPQEATVSESDQVFFIDESDDWTPKRCGVGAILAHAAPAVPTGSVFWFAASTPPQGMLVCDGAAVSRTTYAELFAIIGLTFGAGDGSTSFNLPDLRGEFIRGWDAGRGVDDGRSMGSSQSDELAAHSHSFELQSGTEANGPHGNTGGPHASTQFVTGSSGGVETRPRNVALLPCIKS